MIAGIILAAGASSRMGTPKALLDYRGETFVGRLVRVLGTSCKPVIVVLGYHADVMRQQVPATARIVVNPDPSRGQLSSLQTGLAALPAEADGFAFIPVDSPAVAEDTVAKLARAFERRDPSTLFVIPRQSGKRGHPVSRRDRSRPSFWRCRPRPKRAKWFTRTWIAPSTWMWTTPASSPMSTIRRRIVV